MTSGSSTMSGPWWPSLRSPSGGPTGGSDDGRRRCCCRPMLGVRPSRIEIRAADDGAPDAYVDGDSCRRVAQPLAPRRRRRGCGCSPPDHGGHRPRDAGDPLGRLRARVAVGRGTGGSCRAPAQPATCRCCAAGRARRRRPRCCGRACGSTSATPSSSPNRPPRAGPPLTVTWRTEGVIHQGWWRHDDNVVIAVVTDPPSPRPRSATSGKVRRDQLGADRRHPRDRATRSVPERRPARDAGRPSARAQDRLPDRRG